jgi:tetratricopeptide (TPR) repeat protein
LFARVRQLIQAKQYREAAEACDQLNQQFPEFESGWYTASHLAMAIREPMLAVSAIDRALQLSPGKPEWLFQRVECLGAVGEVAAARATAEQLSDHLFDSAGISAAFAHTLSRLGMYEAARQHYKRATERPDDDEAHLLRAGLVTQTVEVNNVDTLLQALKRADGQARRQVKICFALAKELEDVGDYARSFEFLSKGASLRRSNMNYTPQKDLDAIRNIQKIYTPDLFDGHIEGHINAEPIFVIGMPRTGTTLVERILGSHSVVRSAGELQTFSVELVKHCRKISKEATGNPADLVAVSTSIDFAALGEDYIVGTRPDTGGTAHFIDKLPLNFLYAGLIHLALPKAKIILLERDPMDTCYAVYKNLFEGIYPFSYDLEELANYFVVYRELINHWQSVMPGVMHVVKYEEMVTTPKPVIEDLLSACDLSWEDACLKFYENTFASTTASAVQVRSNIFQSSIGKWRNYEQQLKPVSDILGESL